MMLEWPVISAFAAVSGFGLAFATFWLTFGGRISAAEIKAIEAHSDAKETREKLIIFSAQFSLYREQVAKEYVGREIMREVEGRLTGAIHQLTERFDRFTERHDPARN